jgi:hypothetical protein
MYNECEANGDTRIAFMEDNEIRAYKNGSSTRYLFNTYCFTHTLKVIIARKEYSDDKAKLQLPNKPLITPNKYDKDSRPIIER